jgi:hypothetical protein
MPKASEEYNRLFGIDPFDHDKVEYALNIALDTRKFEIGLYWHRTAFYWTLIAAAFAAYLAVMSVERVPHRSFNAFLVACVGFFFSVAWFMVNLGSKYWQENWENHVDLLADRIAGPIFMTILSRKKDKSKRKPLSERVIGPRAVSVSKVNQWVSLFTILIWIILAGYVVLPLDFSAPVSIAHLAVLGATLALTGLLITNSGTHRGDHKHEFFMKSSAISDD